MKKKPYIRRFQQPNTKSPVLGRLAQWANWSRKQLWSKLVALAEWFDALSLKHIGIGALIALLLLYWEAVNNDDVIIDPFTVPAYFAQEGLTPEVIASRIFDALQGLEVTSNITLGKDNLATYRDEESTPDVEIPGTKVGLKGVVDFAKVVFGSNQLHVSGSIIVPLPDSNKASSTEREATVTIYFIQRKTKNTPTIVKVPAENLDALFEACAKALLRRINPLMLAAYQTDHGEFEQAIALAAKASHEAWRGDPYRSNALSVWGNALSAQKSFDAAIAKYQQAIKLNPQSGGVYLNWGVALANQRKYTEGIQKFQQAIALNPNDAIAYLNWASSLAEEGKHEEAASKFSKAISLAPNAAYTYVAWGNALRYQQKYDQAIAQLQTAIEINPDYALAYEALGQILFEQKKYDEAISKLGKAIALYPSYAEAYEIWGLALAEEEKYDEAELKFQKANSIDPTVGATYAEWGSALVNGHKFKEAIEKLRKGFELGVNDWGAHDNLGYALAMEGNDTAAIVEFKKAIALAPSVAQPYMDWGGMLARGGKYDAAASKYQQAVRMDPTFATERPWGLPPRAAKKFREALDTLPKTGAVSPSK
jgi:tetratricopeptide (TPR) repeat protein